MVRQSELLIYENSTAHLKWYWLEIFSVPFHWGSPRLVQGLLNSVFLYTGFELNSFPLRVTSSRDVIAALWTLYNKYCLKVIGSALLDGSLKIL